jgi:hypothetical protein
VHRGSKRAALGYHLCTPPPVPAPEALHEDRHGLVRTARLQRVVRRLGALALAARELAPLVRVDAVGLQHGVAGDLVQIRPPREHGLLGYHLPSTTHIVRSEIVGAQECKVSRVDNAANKILPQTLRYFGG